LPVWAGIVDWVMARCGTSSPLAGRAIERQLPLGADLDAGSTIADRAGSVR
jgi:hypothetical protein